MKLDWLNDALRIIPESREEKAALVILFYGLGGAEPVDLVGKCDGDESD